MHNLNNSNNIMQKFMGVKMASLFTRALTKEKTVTRDDEV